MNRRPQLTIVAPSASPEEAAAVVAALEQFMRETAPVIVEASLDACDADGGRLARGRDAGGVGRSPSVGTLTR
jgi:hypothetical protein